MEIWRFVNPRLEQHAEAEDLRPRLWAIGDRLHLETLPSYWSDLSTSMGVVLGTPEGCAELMVCGESIPVLPGGEREVCKRKGEKCELIR
jgi:hypothetical protein